MRNFTRKSFLNSIYLSIRSLIPNQRLAILGALFCVFTLCSADTYAFSTRYYISSASTPSGSSSYCVGANSGGYSSTPNGSSCLTTTSGTTTVTRQWYYDGSNVVGPSSTITVSSTGALTPCTLSAADANTIPPGTHTLFCRFTASGVFPCTGTSFVNSPNKTITVVAAPSSVSVTGGGTVCGSATLIASGGSGGTIYYQGTTSDGTSTATASSSQVVSTGGTYYFRARSSGGCWGGEGSASVVLNPATDVSSFTATGGNACVGQARSITVNSSSLGDGVFTVTADLTGANTVPGITATLTISGSTGTFEIPGTALANVGATTLTITNVQNSFSCNAAPSGGNVIAFTVNAVPAPVTVSGAGTFCGSTLLTASGGAGGTIYYQDFVSNGTSTALAGAVQSVLSSGTRYFRARSVEGCWSNEGSATVTVNSVPTAVTVTGGGSFCGSTTINASGGAGGTRYFQGMTPLGTSTVTPSSTQTITTSGTYYFRSLSALGCWSAQGSVFVVVNPNPDLTDFSMSASSVCIGAASQVTVNSSSMADGIYVLTYDLAGANAATGQLATINMIAGVATFNIPVTALLSSGNTNITVTNIQNATSCSGVPASGNSTSFDVNDLPVVSSITPSSTSLCVGTDITFTAGAVSGSGSLVSYNWTGPAGYNTTTATNETMFTSASPASSGNYTLTVTYPNEGCTSDAVVTPAPVVINNLPTVASISPSSFNLCVGIDLTLSAGAVTGAGGLSSYNWSGPNGFTITTGANATVFTTSSVAESGVYAVSVTYPGDGCTSATVTTPSAVQVNNLPTVADITTSSENLCVGTMLTLSAGAVSGAGSLSSYNWSGPAGYTVTTTTNTSAFTPSSTTSSGSYSLSVSFPGTGCTSAVVETAVPVVVNDLPSVASINQSFSQVCIGTDVNFTAGLVNGSGTLSSYNWTGPNSFSETTSANSIVLTTGTTAASGNYSLSVTYPGTGCVSNSVVTPVSLIVNPLPTVAGVTSSSSLLCVGTNFVLSAGTVTGVGSPTYNWSGPDSYLLNGSAANAVIPTSSAAASGNYSLTVTYPGEGCVSSQVVTIPSVTVNPLPSVADVTPSSTYLCAGLPLTFTAGTVTGTGVLTSYNWSGPNSFLTTTTTDNTSIGSVGTAASGDYTVSVTYPGDGCTSSPVVIPTSVTVNPLPASITGVAEVCVSSVTNLGNSDPGGSWASANNLVAEVNASGIVSGVMQGLSTITYTLPTGCTTTAIVTVNPLPAVIAGVKEVCTGLTTQLSNTAAGGTWGEDAAGTIVTIAADGMVSAINDGVSNITYTLPTGCYRTTIVTVHPLPAAILGMSEVCEAGQIPLSNTTSGGAWSSSDASVSTIGSVSGVLSGISAGNATITYTSVHGCIITNEATVNPLPGAIVGNAEVCKGLTTDFDNAATGGTWTSSMGAIAYVDAATGQITGVSDGTSTITYMLGTGCMVSRMVTVHPLPAPIIGINAVCKGRGSILTNSTFGGSWSSSDNIIAPVGGLSGVVSGASDGVAVITYALPTGCIATKLFTVNPLPQLISGSLQGCKGATSSLSNADLGGSWSTSSSAVAGIDVAGVVNASNVGNATITYRLPTGCYTTAVYTVNAVPSAFAGSMQVCEGLSTSLSNSVSGGRWESDNSSIAIAGFTSGIISGAGAGTASVSYTLPTGCYRVQTMTVNAAVPAITGDNAVCVGNSVPMGNTAAGGVWTSSNTSVAIINATDGMVTGVGNGVTSLQYILPTGCNATKIVTVNALPSDITGATQVCVGLSTTLSNATLGGSWSGGTSGVASIDGMGTLTGINAGTSTITYTLSSTGCMRTTDVVINALPFIDTVTGGGSYCADGDGVLVGLNASSSGVTYNLYHGGTVMSVRSGTGSSLSYGMQLGAGTYSVLATNATTGCISSMFGSADVAITPLVTPSVTFSADMGDTVCEGTSVTFIASPVNGGSSPVYEWAVNSSASGSGDTFVYTPANSDIITVKLISSEVCPSATEVSEDMVMQVVDNHTPTVSIVKTSSDTLCQFSPASFAAYPEWGGDDAVINWLRNGSAAGTGTAFTYIPANGDVITCSLISNYRCRLADDATSEAITVDVDSVYVPEVVISATPGLTVAPGKTVTLTAVVSGEGPSPVYEWYLNGNLISGANTEVLSRTFDDNDEVVCTVYGTGFCGLPSFNSVRINLDESALVGGYGVDLADIRLSPNPNNGRFVVSGILPGNFVGKEVMLQVTDLLGQVVYRKTVKASGGKITEDVSPTTTLANGMYMLHLSIGAERKIIPFVIKQ